MAGEQAGMGKGRDREQGGMGSLQEWGAGKDGEQARMGSSHGWGTGRDGEQAGIGRQGRDGEPGLCQPHIPTNSGSVCVGHSRSPAQVRIFHRREQVRKHQLE